MPSTLPISYLQWQPAQEIEVASFEKGKGRSDVVVLHGRPVIVPHCQVILGLDQEVIVHTLVLVVMDDGGQEHG